MGQLQKIYKSLSVGQRIGIVAAVLLIMGGMVSFVRWRHDSDFRPLFTGMAPEDAAGVVQKLKESGVEHQIGGNGSSVLVPSAKVDELRLELAGAGLPKSGRIGFELFDKTNLGITDFSEHVNYRRALEGELERSVRVLSEVEQARIHLSFPKDSVFLDAREPAKASVLVSLRPGAHLSDANVLAITNLVASAVEGLGPEYVSVVDSRGNLLGRPKRSSTDTSDGSDAALEYKHQVEKDLFAKVESTLNPLLGADHFRIGISADCDFSTSEQTDETFDPSHSVMTNSQKSEDLANKPDSTGIPGTASNIPRPISRPGTAGSTVSHKTENVAYETSRSVRQMKIPRGLLKRLSASVLIDQDVRWEGKGIHAKRIFTPPNQDKMKSIRELVAGIIGFTPARGDQLVVQSLAFEHNPDWETEGQTPAVPVGETNSLKKLLKDPKILAGAGGAVLLVMGLLFFALTRKKAVVAPTPAKIAAPEQAANAGSEGQASVGQGDKTQLAARTAEQLQIPEKTSEVETLRQNIRASVSRDPALAAGVLRNWISEMESSG